MKQIDGDILKDKLKALLEHYQYRDDGKANEGLLNLVFDQVLHVVQIVITWIVWSELYGW